MRSWNDGVFVSSALCNRGPGNPWGSRVRVPLECSGTRHKEMQLAAASVIRAMVRARSVKLMNDGTYVRTSEANMLESYFLRLTSILDHRFDP